MKVVEKVKVKNLRKELDVLHEKLTLYRVLDKHRGKLPEPESKVVEIDEESTKTAEEEKDEAALDPSIVNPMRVVKLGATFQDEISLYLVQESLLEQGGKEVWEYCRSFGLENHKVVEFTFYQICKAVQQIHYFQILHRDLKPENMFYVNDRKIVKLIDFGSTMFVDDPELRKTEIDKHPKRNKFTNFVGTPNFMAPEGAHNKETSYASDVWSLGCILYQLYGGINCFRGGSEYLIFLKSTEADYQYPESELIIPQKARDLIDKMIKIEPTERLPLDDVLSDEFFDGVRDLKSLPEVTEQEEAIVEFKKDILKRHNVYKIDSEEKTQETILTNLKDSVGEDYFEEKKAYGEHLLKIAQNYIYNKEWSFVES